MQELKMKIQQEGSVLTSEILKVDSFLNHQLDSELLVQMGELFATHFKDKKITKVMTVETSGIAIALTTAIALKVPVVFGRKQQSVVTDKEVYSAPVFSFTKRTMSRITVSKKLLHQDDHVLIIDDFLAHAIPTSGASNPTSDSTCWSADIVGLRTAQVRDLRLQPVSLSIGSMTPPNVIGTSSFVSARIPRRG